VDTVHPTLGWVRAQADRRERGHGPAVAGAVLWCVLLGWIAFVRGTSIPLLSLVDLGFHELGHLLTYPFPDMITAAAGSVAQVAVPLGLAVYFAWIRTDRIATSVCLTWAATAARDVSVYVRDAPYQRLELIGGEHDWAFLLAAHLDRAERYGLVVQSFGVVLLLAAFVLALAVPFVEERRHHPHRADWHDPGPPTPFTVKYLD
jgi:hypothetical protein